MSYPAPPEGVEEEQPTEQRGQVAAREQGGGYLPSPTPSEEARLTNELAQWKTHATKVWRRSSQAVDGDAAVASAAAAAADDDEGGEGGEDDVGSADDEWDSESERAWHEEQARLAQQEWEEGLAQLQLALQLMLLPFLGKWLGRRWSYWAFARYKQHGLGLAFLGLPSSDRWAWAWRSP